jgi:hypothetical protein
MYGNARGKNSEKKERGRRDTHLQWALELYDLVPVLVDVDLFLRAVASILYEDEQERADEPGEGVPFHRRVAPCARKSLRRDEHA